MASTTPNIGLTLPTGAEKVSRQIINDNNTKIDNAIGTLNNKISTVKSVEITHGSINAETSSTVQIPITKRMYVIGYSVSGTYNSDCIPWSYYCTSTEFVSRVKNTGSNNASNISVIYQYFEME